MTWPFAALTATALAVAAFIYLAWYVRWEARQTRGMAYYGRPLPARQALKRRIRLLSWPAMPLVRVLARLQRADTPLPSFEYQGVCGPPKVSSPEVFARATQYRPRREDVFVVTQMRCGTTWMQQLVHETVTRGRGDFGQGRGHLYAISPWIDAANGVSIEGAPLLGEPPTRIIKSHLPTSLCPYNADAKYIYVTRHPVSCFASIVDYNRTLLGPFMPSLDVFADWFCSDRMYWLPWPRHVADWWDWAETRGNVLFIHFEEMKSDFDGVRNRVASFLGVSLTAAERQLVTDTCSFQYMQAHEEWFDMSPPTMFSAAGGRFMRSGAASRHEDVTPAIRKRILEYCRGALAGRAYPSQRFYPDIIRS
jgi:hypothetical protein